VVRRLAGLLNGVHAATAGAFVSCPAFQASYRIAFAVSSRATPYLVAKATTCPGLQVTAGGHAQPALLTPAGLLPLLERLTGVAAQGGSTVPPGGPVPGHGRPGMAHPLPRVTSVPRG
jgi:hypothetical protein